VFPSGTGAACTSAILSLHICCQTVARDPYAAL
jgi:hypothetical protein